MKAGDPYPTDSGQFRSAAAARASGIRWDAVVDRRLADIGKAQHDPAVAATDRSAKSIQVHVQLFGALGALCAERSIRLEQPPATSIADLLAVVEQRLGVPLRVHVLDETGVKRRHCRLFVDGYAVEDVQKPLGGTPHPTDIDIILLIAPEGG
jgi:hypothetical protein